MIKRFVLILCCICALLSVPAYAVGIVPSDRFYYIDCNTEELGDILIVIPSNYGFQCLEYAANGNICNVTSSNVTGYVYTDSTYQEYLYSIRWSALGTTSTGYNYYSIYPSYRTYNNGSTSYYELLHINEVYSTNMDLSSGVVIDDGILILLVALLVSGILFIVIVRRRR